MSKESVKIEYNDEKEYVEVYTNLINLEMKYYRTEIAEYSRMIKTIEWSKDGLHRTATFTYPGSSGNLRNLISVGDVLFLTPESKIGDKKFKRYKGRILKMPGKFGKTFELNMDKDWPNRSVRKMPFLIELEFDTSTFKTMLGNLNDLQSFTFRLIYLQSELYKILLGKEKSEAKAEYKIALPDDIRVPGLPELNPSQKNAMENAFSRVLTLIQGPPGTGKTTTAATIIYHTVKETKGRVLVCSPSNIAVDNLAQHIAKTGLKVIRVSAKSRDLKHCSVIELDLRTILKKKFSDLSTCNSRKYNEIMLKDGVNLIEKMEVICCTCSTAGNDMINALRPYNAKRFQLVLIDESTQGIEPETLIPIMKGAVRVVLIGDQKQLGPTIMSKEAENCGLKMSMFERLIKAGNDYFTLKEQYRMHPSISRFPREAFYDGVLKDGISEEHRQWLDIQWNFPAKVPIMFWDCNGREEQHASGKSYFNPIEALNVTQLVEALLRAGAKHYQIGIITPYDAQREYIIKKFFKNGKNKGEIEIANVDAFQGREKDIIIISTVRSNMNGNIGFLHDKRRLNVALTRAKFGLIIIGNAMTLRMSSYTWRNLLKMYEMQRCLVEGPLENLEFLTKNIKNLEFSTKNIDEIDELSEFEEKELKVVDW